MFLATRVYVLLKGHCVFVFSAIHPEMAVTSSKRCIRRLRMKKKKKKRSDRQEYVSLYYSTNHYTNEDVLSSPSPRKRETSAFRELNLDLSVLTTSGLLRNLDLISVCKGEKNCF